MESQEEILKNNLYKKFNAFYNGYTHEFPKWEFIYRVTKLYESSKSDFATLIYHVLNDLFTVTSYTWAEYISIDRRNKIATLIQYTTYINDFKVKQERVIIDYNDKPAREWNSIKRKTVNSLNIKPLTLETYKYERYTNNNIDMKSWGIINKVKESYKEAFVPSIYSTIPPTSFEDYIKDENLNYGENIQINNPIVGTLFTNAEKYTREKNLNYIQKLHSNNNLIIFPPPLTEECPKEENSNYIENIQYNTSENQEVENKKIKWKQHRNPVSAEIMINVVNAIEDYSNEKFTPKNYENSLEKFSGISKRITEVFGEGYQYSAKRLKNASSININEDDKAKVIKILREYNFKAVATKYKNDQERA